ncbi:MAG: hypothetical protein ACRDZQ_03005, partial [Acidimicrobiales bacterium]
MASLVTLTRGRVRRGAGVSRSAWALWRSGWRSVWPRHRLLVLALAAGSILRVLVTIAYWPALELAGDSYSYLRDAHRAVPGIWHPIGYPLLLIALSPTGSIGVVTVVQHLLGLGLAVGLYALLLRLGVRRPLAVVGTLPVLLGGYQLDVEQFVLAETLVDALLVAGLAVLLWRRRISPLGAGVAGFLLAAATLSRTAALPVLAVAGVYLVLRRWWRPLLAGGAVALLTLLTYGGWYAGVHGHFGYSDDSGYLLYGRVATFATCDYPLPQSESKLCPLLPVGQRPDNLELYVWQAGSPLRQPGLGSHLQRDRLARRFAVQVILHQPLAYAAAVGADTWHYFAPGRWMTADRVDLRRWRFPGPGLDPNADRLHVAFANAGFGLAPIRASVSPALMGPLRLYQSIVYTRGWLLLAALLGAAAAGAVLL